MAKVFVSVTITRNARVLRDGMLLEVGSNSTLGQVLDKAITDAALERPPEGTVKATTSTVAKGDRQDAKLTDNVEMHVQFERKYLFFTITTPDTTPAAQAASPAARLAVSEVEFYC